MKPKLIRLSHRYVTALRKHPKPGSGGSLRPALRLGRRAAVVLGLDALNRRTRELGITNRRLRRVFKPRENVEAALKKSDEHHAGPLKDSVQLQKRLRQLTYRVLARQEAEREKISRGLREEIAQTLLGINILLISFKREARRRAKDLGNEFASTQRWVARSCRSVRWVARELMKA